MRSDFFTNKASSAHEVAELVSCLRETSKLLQPGVIRQIEDSVFTEEAVVPIDLETVVVLGSRNCGYRVECALKLASMAERRYVVSGGNLMANGSTEAVNMEAQLVAGGISPTMILKETRARNTKENLELILPLLKRLGSKRIGLITGGFHMQRTLRAATEIFTVLSDHVLYPISAYGPHTSPGSWWKSNTGRLIIADELEKLLSLGILASR